MCLPAFRIDGYRAAFVCFAVVLCETQVSLRSSGPAVTSTNHTRDRHISTNYTPAVRTGVRGLGGGVKEVADDRDSEQSSCDRNGVLPFSINGQIFVVE